MILLNVYDGAQVEYAFLNCCFFLWKICCMLTLACKIYCCIKAAVVIVVSSAAYTYMFMKYIFVLSLLQSFSGHTSGVECVRFSGAEDMVVAGSMSGALKIWDLEAAKSMEFVSKSLFFQLLQRSTYSIY